MKLNSKTPRLLFLQRPHRLTPWLIVALALAVLVAVSMMEGAA
jgi:hypothetical protein